MREKNYVGVICKITETCELNKGHSENIFYEDMPLVCGVKKTINQVLDWIVNITGPLPMETKSLITSTT